MVWWFQKLKNVLFFLSLAFLLNLSLLSIMFAMLQSSLCWMSPTFSNWKWIESRFKMNFSSGAGRCTKCFWQFQRDGGFIFILKNGNFSKVWGIIWNSLQGRGMDFFWNRTFQVANLATNFQDLVAKVENLVALVPVLGTISCPDNPWCKLL